MQETAEIVALAPKEILDKAREIISNHLKRPVDLMPFYSALPHGAFSWNSIKDRFLKACQGAKVVILHDWIQAENPHEGYQLAEQIAEEVKAINPHGKIFASPTGGVYPAPVHKIAGILFSLSEPSLLNALKKA